MAFSLFGLLLCVYLLLYSGIPHSSDEFIYLGLGQSLARGQPPIAHQVTWMVDLNHVEGRYALIALMLVPFNWLSSLLPQTGVYQSDVLLMPVVLAMTGALMFCALQELGYSRRISFLTALALGIASPLLVYSKYIFREPLAALALSWLVFSLVRLHKNFSRANLFSMGAALILGVAAKDTFVSTAPGLLLCLWLIVRSNRQPTRTRPIDRTWVRWILGTAVVGSVIGSAWLGSQTRLLDAAMSFLGGGNPLGGSFGIGLAGLLISPGRGLFWYAPILFIALAAFPRFVKKYPIEAFLVATVSVASLLLHAAYATWWGGRGWGPRFLLPIIPLWCLPLAEAFEWSATFIKNRHPATPRSHIARFALLGVIEIVVGLSVGVQLLGAGIAFDQYEDYLGTTKEGSRVLSEGGDFHFAFQFSPFVVDRELLKPANLDFAWIKNRKAADGIRIHVELMASLIIGVGWFAASPLVLLRLNRRRDLLLVGFVSLSAVCWIITYLLSVAYTDERYQGASYQASIDTLSKQARTGDGLLIELQPRNWFQTASYFLNFLQVPKLTTFSLISRGFPDADGNLGQASAMLQPIVARHQTLWLHSEPTRVDNYGTQFEEWLTIHEFLLKCAQLNPRSQLCLYSVERQPGTRRVDLNVMVGDQIRLVRGAINMDAKGSPMVATHPGTDVQVSLNWFALGTIKRVYKVFIQLIDAHGALRQQIDREPVNGLRPTNRWIAGQEVEDRYAMRLEALEPGQYHLIVGLYDGETIERLPIRDAHGNSVGNFVELAILDVN